MMIVLLILSIILAAFAPVMTTRSKAIKTGGGGAPSEPGGDIWKYASGNAQIYYDENGAANMAMIGQKTVGTGENARLIINTTNNDAQNHILFKRNGTNLSGFLRLDAQENFRFGGNTTVTTVGGYINAGRNTGVGVGSMASLTTNNNASNNTAMGHNALRKNATGYGNTAVGSDALTSLGNSHYNTAVGDGALANLPSGQDNTAVGWKALHKASNYYAYSTSNTAVGSSALYANQDGSANTAVGSGALMYAQGSRNTVVGAGAASDGSFTGSQNVAVGYWALQSNRSGNSNVSIGDYSLHSSQTGSNNTALGWQGCISITGGSNNTCIGSNSGPTSNGTYNNTVWLGGASRQSIPATSTVYITGTTYVNGSMVQTSDGRLKNIKGASKDGLEKIKQLKIYDYTRKDDDKKTPRVGVIAQELKKIFPNAVSEGDNGYLAIRMEDILYALVNAVKELDAKISEALKQFQSDLAAFRNDMAAKDAKIKELEERIRRLEEKLK